MPLVPLPETPLSSVPLAELGATYSSGGTWPSSATFPSGATFPSIKVTTLGLDATPMSETSLTLTQLEEL